MSDEKADRIIALLESIDEKLTILFQAAIADGQDAQEVPDRPPVTSWDDVSPA